MRNGKYLLVFWGIISTSTIFLFMTQDASAISVKAKLSVDAEKAIDIFNASTGMLKSYDRGITRTAEDCSKILQNIREGSVLVNHIVDKHRSGTGIPSDVRRRLTDMENNSESIFDIYEAGISCSGGGLEHATISEFLDLLRLQIQNLRYYIKCYIKLPAGSACSPQHKYPVHRRELR